MSKHRSHIFIGSSSEGLKVAEAIQANLDHDAECAIWTQGLFGPSGGTLESLTDGIDGYDFAILVLTPDDTIESCGENINSPRDNVLLELGMFIGGLGRQRTFMVVDRKAGLKLPSDLAGITPATFQRPRSGGMQAAVGSACTAIKGEIEQLGPRKRVPVNVGGNLFIDVSGQGVWFGVTNRSSVEFPPHFIRLETPSGVSFKLFTPEKPGPLLPEQKRAHHSLILHKNKGLDLGWAQFLASAPDGSPYTFQLVLEDSEKVLYSNTEIALVLYEIAQEARDKNGIGITEDQRQRLQSDWTP